MDRYIEFVTNHWMLFIALCVVTFLLIQELLDSAFQKFESISPILAVAQMNDDNTVVLDVREENEFNNGHIENAINAPYGKFEEHLKTLENYKTRPLIVICQNGTRSTPASKKLSKQGFEKVYNLSGGLQSWEENKLPIRKTPK